MTRHYLAASDSRPDAAATVLRVARHRGLERQPRDYLASGTWPTGPLTDDAPDVARFVRRLAQRLDRYLEEDDRSLRQIAKGAGMPHQTIRNIVAGETWCDLPTIYRLECELEQPLWINMKLPTEAERREERRSRSL